jgi:benzylsuccinate CoA-transferase BbsF subunit
MSALPLRGIRVVDFTWHGAGPYTTKVLADHGADVIRIESTKRLDRLRVLPPFRDKIKGDSVNRSGYYADRNSNKQSVTINLKHPSSAALILRLAEQSDIIASNFTPGTMESLGVGYEAVRAIRPDIIFLEMGMQGAYGPDASLVGYGQTVSALTGLHHLSGLPGRVPVGTGTNYPDHVPAPSHAAFAVLVALRHRRRTGEGQYIDLSQAETMVSLLGPSVLDWTVNSHNTMPQGNRSPEAAPHGVYPCAGNDRWLALSVGTQEQWTSLVDELGLTDDPRFATLDDRHRNHDALDTEISGRTRELEPFDLMTRLQKRGVAAGVVQNYQDLLETDPQLRHRNHFVVLDHPEMGPSAYNAPPFTLSGPDEPTMRTPAPLLGQHTRQVCADLLAMSDDEIDRLIAEGVLV